MVYTVIMLIMFFVLFIIKSPKCRFTIYFVSIAISFTLMFFSNIMFITKFGNYGTPDLNIFTLDYSLYMLLFKIRFSYSAMVNIFNFGFGMFLYMPVVFADMYINVEPNLKITRLKLKKHSSYLVFPILFFIFYNPAVGDNLYFIYNSLQNTNLKNFMEYMIRGLDITKYIILVIYLFYPLRKLYNYSKKVKLTYIKKQIMGIEICLALLNIIGILLLVISPAKRVYYKNFSQCLLYTTETIDFPFRYYSSIFLVMFIIIMVMIYLLIHYRSLDSVDFFGELSIRYNMRKLNENVRGTYHSLKTHMFTVNILAKRAEEQFGNEEGLEAIKKLQFLAQKNLDNISSMLNSFKDIKLSVREQQISNIINTALSIVPCNDVEIESNLDDSIRAVCDFYNICECIVNLLKNSIDAIKEKGCEGKIIVESYFEQEWVVIKITDNGEGIDRKSSNEIFKPFYSTKSKQNNFGIGLSYVYKIVSKHHGILYFESEKHIYTTFYLCLKRII